MEEPTHTHESQFWDQVADWLLEARTIDLYLSADEIEALMRANRSAQAGPAPT